MTAFDPYGNVATGDNDPLTFDSSDPQAVLPTGALISGTGNFSLTLKTTGSQSLTVHDGSVSQQQSVQVFAAGVNNLLLSPLPSSVQAGTAQSFTVTARDAFGNTVTSDNDPLSFNSSDGAATLPTGSLASGTGTFFVTFRTAGARSITVNDNGVTQIDNTVVSPGPTDHLLINFTSGSPTAGVSDGVTISAFDQFGNLATGDNDPLGFSSSDLRAVLPSGHLTNGTGSFNVTFISAGVQSLTVTDQTISKSGSVNVIPGPTQSLTITGLPPTMTAGTSHTFTVQALDAFGNFATGDNDTLSFSSNDSNATLPIGSLVNGAGIFSVTFRTAGSRFVNATDNGIVGGGDTTTVVAGAPFSMNLTPLPSQVTAGVSQGISVTLFDQFGNVAASDNDLLSLTSSDPQAVLSPATLNGGIGTVGVTFKTAGPQSVTVHDLTISGSDTTTVGAANATVLSITNLNANPTAGVADGFSVIARDPFGNIATGDNDTLNFGSTDSQAVLPTGSLTNGIGTFSVTFKTAGSQSISAHDGILLATGPVTVAPGPLASLAIVGLPASSSAGTMLPFTVTAHDAFGNVVTGDNHTLTFSSSDGLAVLPTGGLTNGTGSFDVTFNSAGPQTMTVFDGSIAQTAHVTIAASTIDHLGINVSNSSPNAGQAITFTVTAFDSHGNVASTDNDTLVFSSSDSKAVLPSGALTNGIGNFGATFKTAGTDSLTVTDGSVSISTNFNVIPGPTASLVVSGLPTSVVAGTSHLFTVTAFDAFGNVATSDNNTPNFQSSDPQATLPIGPLSNGVGTFAITLRTAGNQFVNAIENGIVGTGDSTTVQAAAPQFMHLTPLPSQVTAGVQATLTATLIDPFGNVVTLDNDPLSFTLSDPLATLPTATLIDGQATVGITFKTAGLQSITVHDQAISSTDSTTVVAASPETLSILNLNPNPIAGAPDSFNLIARDAFGNIATSDNDTLSFTSSDPQVLLPIGSLSSGIGTFSITFKTAGGQSVTAHDGSLFATGSVTVSPGALASLTISGLPPSSSAGISLPFTVTAHDAFGNTVTNDNDVLSFNSTDPLAVLPSAGSSLNHGMGAFAVTFNSPNVQSITVIDGSVSQTAFVNINANAPSTPSMPVLDPSTDSGVKGDNVTNVTTPLLTGTAQAGSTVSFFDSGAPIGSTIATPSGTYSFVPAVQLGNGQHVITAQASNSAGTSAMSAPLPLTIDTMLPAVQSVVINDGSAQRSMVDSITIHFTEAINFSPTAFELDTVDPTTGVSTPVTATITPTLSSDGMSVTLTFSGSGIINRSLADGNYVLTVHASGIQNLAGNAMGDGSVTKFHRLFGDIDGDGHITSVDLLAWRTALNQTTSSSHYVWYLDFDGINGDDRNDYNQVLARYLNRTTYTN